MGCVLCKGLLVNDVFVVVLYSFFGNVGDGILVNVLRFGFKELVKLDVYFNIFRRNKVMLIKNKNSIKC